MALQGRDEVSSRSWSALEPGLLVGEARWLFSVWGALTALFSNRPGRGRCHHCAALALLLGLVLFKGLHLSGVSFASGFTSMV